MSGPDLVITPVSIGFHFSYSSNAGDELATPKLIQRLLEDFVHAPSWDVCYTLAKKSRLHRTASVDHPRIQVREEDHDRAASISRGR